MVQLKRSRVYRLQLKSTEYKNILQMKSLAGKKNSYNKKRASKKIEQKEEGFEGCAGSIANKNRQSNFRNVAKTANSSLCESPYASFRMSKKKGQAAVVNRCQSVQNIGCRKYSPNDYRSSQITNKMVCHGSNPNSCFDKFINNCKKPFQNYHKQYSNINHRNSSQNYSQTNKIQKPQNFHKRMDVIEKEREKQTGAYKQSNYNAKLSVLKMMNRQKSHKYLNKNLKPNYASCNLTPKNFQTCQKPLQYQNLKWGEKINKQQVHNENQETLIRQNLLINQKRRQKQRYSQAQENQNQIQKMDIKQACQKMIQISTIPIFRNKQNKQNNVQSNNCPNLLANRSDFKFIYQIGFGGFGKVWKVQQKLTWSYFAMKQIQKKKVLQKDSVDCIMNQKHILSRLNHPFLVNIKYAFQDKQCLYLIMDYLRGADLRYHICYKEQFTQIQTKFIIACLILALEQMQSHGIVHRDIKPQNLVLEESGYVRLTDFGIAKYVKDLQIGKYDSSGTPGYMAPQILMKLPYNSVSDFFAVGIIAYQLMLNKRPYYGKNRKQIKQKIRQSEVFIQLSQLPENWSPQSFDFINRLLRHNPNKRLGCYQGVKQLKQHAWMCDINWRKLYRKQIVPPFIPNIVCQGKQYLQEIQNYNDINQTYEVEINKNIHVNQNQNIDHNRISQKVNVGKNGQQITNTCMETQTISQEQNKLFEGYQYTRISCVEPSDANSWTHHKLNSNATPFRHSRNTIQKNNKNISNTNIKSKKTFK